jgi:CDP-6-deoxy-D-xylo-4-hexulose-3-dehydrase
VTNVAPILQLGLKPVFCDISLEHFSFDINNLPKDSDIKLVFVTHLLGLNAPVERLKERYPNAIFIEDICESHGVTDDLGVRRGSTSSEGGTFSFYYGHHMTTIEGGMVSTNNKELYDLMKLKRSHGLARELPTPEYINAQKKYPEIDGRFLFLTDGYNFRNTEIGAVLGLSQLKRLDDSIATRKSNYSYFVSKLSKYTDHFYIPSKDTTNSSFVFPIVCKDPRLMTTLKAAFERHGIENRPIVGGNLLKQPFLKDFKGYRLPNADILNDNGVYIGNSQFVNFDMIDKMFDIFSECGI